MTNVPSSAPSAQIPTTTVGARRKNTPAVSRSPETGNSMDDITAMRLCRAFRRMADEVAASGSDRNRRRRAVRRFQALLDARPSAGRRVEFVAWVPRLSQPEGEPEAAEFEGRLSRRAA
jgi:hypothetical protein